MLQNLCVFLLPSLLILAAASDVMSFRIPNWLTLLTAGLFFPMALAAHMPWPEFGSHLAAGGILFVVGFLFFQAGIFGGGDAKLMAAAGLWFGTASMLPFLFMTALAGGVLALAVAFWSAFMVTWEIEGDAAPFARLGQKLRALGPNVPYGFAFALGGIIAFKDTWWMNAIN
ncbi:A24 family peptidase [Aestuariivirga litoralis]|uniref:A24 family peptidase n=1 Tax=Aestuariivirga litoralis TaxID=2650924 RepID=UPI0018C6B8C8|nr:prepilin peptidase [Aestuariivirga litoralis]MBG1233952.1 pilus assembly protein CpaA [Aestuariivirga litoralis]